MLGQGSSSFKLFPGDAWSRAFCVHACFGDAQSRALLVQGNGDGVVLLLLVAGICRLHAKLWLIYRVHGGMDHSLMMVVLGLVLCKGTSQSSAGHLVRVVIVVRIVWCGDSSGSGAVR